MNTEQTWQSFPRRGFLRAGFMLTMAQVGCAAARASGTPAERFGIRPEASPEANERGMRNALEFAQAEGGIDLVFGPGEYHFAIRYPWVLPAGTRLAGVGKGRTVLRRVDDGAWSWMTAKNSRGGYALRGFTAIGNNRASGSGDGAFFDVELNEKAVGHMEGFALADVELRNFRGDGWIRFILAGPARHDIRSIRIDGSCSFHSAAGNGRGPNDLGIWSSAIAVIGNLDPKGALGRIRDVFVGPVVADIPHIKSLCIFWGGVVGARIERPVIERCGTIGIAPNCGAYALVVGNETLGAPNPDQVDIVGPVIKACLSVGVYFVSWGGKGGTNRFDGAGGYIANVTDTVNGSLPKGAVAATDGATNLIIRNVRAINCVSAVDTPLATDGTLIVDGVDAEGVPANQVGVRVGMQEGFTNTGPAKQIILRNIRVRSNAPGVTGVRFDTRHPMGPVQMGGTIDIDVPFLGVSAYNEGGRGSVAPFSTFEWSGEATIRNARAGAIVFRDNVSPITISARITIERGTIAGNREPRIKAAGTCDLKIFGSVQIDGVRAQDGPPWEGRGGQPCRPVGRGASGSYSVTTELLAKCPINP